MPGLHTSGAPDQTPLQIRKSAPALRGVESSRMGKVGHSVQDCIAAEVQEADKHGLPEPVGRRSSSPHAALRPTSHTNTRYDHKSIQLRDRPCSALLCSSSFRGSQKIVGIQDRDKLTLRMPNSEIARRAHPQVPMPWMFQAAYAPLRVFRVLARNPGSGIGFRAIIDKQQLPLRISLGKDAFDRFGKKTFCVVERNHNRNQSFHGVFK